ncbi:MAG: hypothetical protein HHJ12_18595 [Glaciimonas sp.]|nr:hypothetical protein [Glaciimonas sp.]
MPNPIIKTINVQAGVSKDYLESILTTDITVLESIFDLIDNSIDAARDHLLSGKCDSDIYGLPNDYSGYKVSIRLSRKSISVLDNCLGFDELTLTQKAFVTADISNHRFGIGHYGLGLKRSLLKFGSSYELSTDNGKVAFKMQFDGEKLSGNLPFPANVYKSSGKRKTLFVVSNIKPDILYEIQNKLWFENALEKVAARYALYINKGLEINFSNEFHEMQEKIKADLPTIRKNSKFDPIHLPLKIEGVQIFIEAGIHSQYTFPSEKEIYSRSVNLTLTDYYGLYFICNDRVIVSSSTEREHGWKTKWHSEYNGFVCIVRFVSEDSGRMPWNTFKTALRTDGALFMQLKDKLQPIAENYRTSIKKLYPAESKNNTQPADAKQSATSPSKITQKNGENKKGGAGQDENRSSAKDNEQSHPKNWTTLLPGDFPITKDAILNGFIIEASNLACLSAPCAGAMLLRAILEKSLRDFVKRTGKFGTVKDHFYATKEGQKKNRTQEQKDNHGIDLAMMLGWLKVEKTIQEIFGAEEKQILWVSVKYASEHVPKLNGVVHGVNVFDAGELIKIRNEIYPLLKHLVSSGFN